MVCAICQTRRPRRFCPGVRGDICAICCGTEREVSVSCPLDCEYLRQAREHEKTQPLDPNQLPNRDIRISENMLRENEGLFVFMAQTVGSSALAIPGAVDSDVREALEALIRTYRTLESGVYYESLPTNPLAAAIYRHLQEAVATFRQQETRQLGVTKTRDANVLAYLVYLQRIAIAHQSSRPRSRAFIDTLARDYGERSPETASPDSRLILP